MTKYTIERVFSFRNQKFKINCHGKAFCSAIATRSKEFQGRFNIKVSNPKNKYIGEDICLVEPNPDRARSYSIYLKNEKKNLFGEISYRLDNSNQYEYTIDIGNRRYRTRSLDLRNRHLTILDMTPSRSSLQPEMLFEVMETFSRVNKKYNMTIYDEQGRYAYLAIVILLILLEQE